METFLANNLVVVALSVYTAALVLIRFRDAASQAVENHLINPFRESLDSRELLAALIDVAIHAGFLGSAAGPLLGLDDHHQIVLLAIAWALFMVLVVKRLLWLVNVLDQEEASIAHRRTAGTIRSIVRSELGAAAKRAQAVESPVVRRRRKQLAHRGCSCCADLNIRKR